MSSAKASELARMVSNLVEHLLMASVTQSIYESMCKACLDCCSILERVAWVTLAAASFDGLKEALPLSRRPKALSFTAKEV